MADRTRTRIFVNDLLHQVSMLDVRADEQRLLEHLAAVGTHMLRSRPYRDSITVSARSVITADTIEVIQTRHGSIIGGATPVCGACKRPIDR